MLSELETLVKKAMNKEKVDGVEVYCNVIEEVTQRTMLDKIESSEYSLTTGYSVRVLKDDMMGFAYFDKLSDFEKAVKHAKKSMIPSYGFCFPNERYEKVKLFDKEVVEFSLDDVYEVINNVVSFFNGKEARLVQAEVKKVREETFLVNSEGFSGSYDDALVSFELSVQKGRSLYYDGEVFKQVPDFNAFTEKVYNDCLLTAEGKRVSGEYDVIFSKQAVVELVNYFLGNALDGEGVFFKQSFFEGKIGQEVASFSIYDNPLLDYGGFSYPFDDEGVKAFNKKLIDRGVLKQFIFDLKTSSRMNTTPTGNAVRRDYQSLPSIELSNVILEPIETISQEDVDGLKVFNFLGLYEANLLSGDFSFQVDSGCLIEKGEPVKPVSGCTLVGNFFEMIKHAKFVNDFGRKYNYYGPSWVVKLKVV